MHTEGRGAGIMPGMLSEILLYVDLLVFLAGALLYGYLAREILFRPSVLPGNYGIRGGLIALAFFYLGTLLDEQIFLLQGVSRRSLAGTAWDLLRAASWLMAFPLINQTLAFALKVTGGRAPRMWVLPGWATLALFLWPAHRFLEAQSPILAEATAGVYTWVVLHAIVNLLSGAVLASLLAQRMSAARALARMLLGMQAVFVGLALFFLATYWIDPWSAPRLQAEPLQLITRTAVLAALLLPGFLMAVFVRRDHVLRLSLSFRTLRHFLSVLVLVVLVMAAGPALGMVDVGLYRRMVAWGLLMALFFGALYRPVADALFARYRPLRRLMGRNLSPSDLEDLIDRLTASEVSDSALLDATATELSTLLTVRARFLAPPSEDRRTAVFWHHYESESGDSSQASQASQAKPVNRRPVHRLDPGDGRLAAVLALEELQAVFPVWVDGQLEALLALSVADGSPWGGGLDDGELEAVSLLLRQVSAVLSSRRRMANRLAEERRMAEHERLGLLGLVAASLAHEVKNPLSSIKVLAQTLREDLAEKDPNSDGVLDLDAIVEQIDRLDQTTREILGVARPNDATHCDLAALVRSAVYVIGADAKRRGVVLEGQGVAEIGEIAGSPASWQTVIFNMVLNAVFHTAPGDKVEVRLERLGRPKGQDVEDEDSEPESPEDGDRWLFEVTNPVKGKTSADVEKWFEPFVTDGGTGLGLALVARRAEELGVTPSGQIDQGVARFRVEGRI